MHLAGCQCTEEFNQIIPVRHPVHGIPCGDIESKLSCGKFPIQRIGGSCQGTGSERTGVHPEDKTAQMFPVSSEHLKISTEVVCQCYRLRFLKMCEARHESIQVLLHHMKDRLQEMFEKQIHLTDLIPDIQLHIERHLVISAAPRMEFLAGISDPIDQMRFHEAVDIFVLVCEFQFSTLNVRKNPAQGFDDRLCLFIRDDSLFPQHGGVGDTPPDILPVQPLVERQ